MKLTCELNCIYETMFILSIKYIDITNDFHIYLSSIFPIL